MILKMQDYYCYVNRGVVVWNFVKGY